MTSESDLLLTSGPTWIDALTDVFHAQSVTVHVDYAVDGGEQAVITSVGGRVCDVFAAVAIRQWGAFVIVNQSFFAAPTTCATRDLLCTLSQELFRGCRVDELKKSLGLREVTFRAFQQSGLDAIDDLLQKAGWRRVEPPDDEKLVEQNNLECYPYIAVGEVFPEAVANNAICRVETREMGDLFNIDRSSYWKHENELRSSITSCLDHYGQKCSELLVFLVNHGTYIAKRPIEGWKTMASTAWPTHLIQCGDHELIYAPEVGEGVVLNHTNREIIGCGVCLSERFAEFVSRRQGGTVENLR